MLDIFLSCIVFTLVALRCIAGSFGLFTPTSTINNSIKDLDNILPGTSIINITNAVEDQIGCFMQASPDKPQLTRTNFIDCSQAYGKIAAQDPHEPVHFRRNIRSIFLLPNIFTYRTCVIYIDMVDANDEDFFYIAQIGDVAIDTARKCTSMRKALGGKGLAGPKKLVEVTVVGKVWPWRNEGVDAGLLDGEDAVA